METSPFFMSLLTELGGVGEGIAINISRLTALRGCATPFRDSGGQPTEHRLSSLCGKQACSLFCFDRLESPLGAQAKCLCSDCGEKFGKARVRRLDCAGYERLA
jgi:hypothetical protein